MVKNDPLKRDFTCEKRTICEVLREIYDIVSDQPKVVELLEEASIMAKKMSNKLYEYKYDVTQNSEDNYNYKSSKALRNSRVHSN